MTSGLQLDQATTILAKCRVSDAKPWEASEISNLWMDISVWLEVA